MPLTSVMRLTRAYRFSASHRLHTASLTGEENASLYGKCNHPYGHGHNYVLEVSVRGEVGPETGRIVAPAMLDEFVRLRVLSDFHDRYMNLDIPEFQDLVPTTENVAGVMRDRLLRGWAEQFPSVALDRVRIEETKRNFFEVQEWAG